MECFVGLDVSQAMTSVAIIDAEGGTLLEVEVPTEPTDINDALRTRKRSIQNVGLEAGPLSAWLHFCLTKAGYPTTCIETNRMSRLAKASPIKTDRSDAMAIAQAMRANLYQPVHVKSPRSALARALLVHRSKIVNQARDLERMLRGTMKVFGLRIGPVTEVRFAERVRELAKGAPGLTSTVEPVLAARERLRKEAAKMTKRIKEMARRDDVTRRFMTVPGVGPMTAVAFQATIDDPSRFSRINQVGAHLGLVPRLRESGEMSVRGRITRHGDRLLRRQLYLSARSLLINYRGENNLRRWGLSVAKRRGSQKAYIGVARKLAIVLLAMWRDEAEFRATPALAP